jgi:hypothetical protein
MDWRWAKAVLLIAFACLDAFLGWRLSAQSRPPVVATAAPAPVPPPPVDLAGAGVVVAPGVRLPADAPVLPLLRVRLQPPDGRSLVGSLFRGRPVTTTAWPVEGQARVAIYTSGGEELDVLEMGLVRYQRHAVPAPRVARLDAETARRWADQFVERLGGLSPDGAFDYAEEVGPGQFSVHYVQQYRGLDVFRGVVEVLVDRAGVASASRFWLQLFPEEGDATARPVLPAAEALVRLAASLGASPAAPLRVQDVRLGYDSASYQQGRWWDMGPAWRVRLADGGVRYVNAYTGALER